MATYDLAYPGAAIDAILNTAYFLQEAGYIFQGSASEYSGTPSKRVWLIAPAGFTGLGLSSAVPQGSIGICLYNGTSWVGKIINVATIDSTPTQNSGNAVSSGGAYAAINQLSASVAEALNNLTFTDSTPSAFQDDYIYMKVSTTEGGVERILTYLTILAATTSKAGLMSAEDKAKVDSFLTGIRSMQFVDATTSAEQSIKLVEQLKWTVGGVQEVIDSITLLAATSSKAGLLSASDKEYIDALPATLTNLSNSISGALALMQSLVGYYVCDTAAGTAAKTVAATGYSLTNGGCIRIKMTNANTADNVTLNINSTGAKALYYDGAQASSTNSWEAGEVLVVYYDGTQYQCSSNGNGKYENSEDWDFAILDNNGNVIFCIKGGNIITKNFKSESIAVSVGDVNISRVAYTVTDANGNMAFVITNDGHIVTKNFDSHNVSSESFEALEKLSFILTKFSGKCLAIVGDSISTYIDYIPAGWRCYYPYGDVRDASRTYWYQVANFFNMTIQNSSYSASFVTGDSTQTEVSQSAAQGEIAGCSTARITSLTRDGKIPDIVLIMLGTNDYGSQRALGSWNEHSAIVSEGSIYQFSSAYSLMLNKIKTALPNARIFCCTILQRNFSFPENTISIKDYNDVIKGMANIFGCDIIDTYACGISRYNISSLSVDGILHPNAAGHQMIANKIITELIAKY